MFDRHKLAFNESEMDEAKMNELQSKLRAIMESETPPNGMNVTQEEYDAIRKEFTNNPLVRAITSSECRVTPGAGDGTVAVLRPSSEYDNTPDNVMNGLISLCDTMHVGRRHGMEEVVPVMWLSCYPDPTQARPYTNADERIMVAGPIPTDTARRLDGFIQEILLKKSPKEAFQNAFGDIS